MCPWFAIVDIDSCAVVRLSLVCTGKAFTPHESNLINRPSQITVASRAHTHIQEIVVVGSVQSFMALWTSQF
jgi:hypothetical protein